MGAKSLIFPRFILDESLGYHVDRARGPLLQAVANGVSLNLLGVLALHALLRGRIRGVKAAVLLACLAGRDFGDDDAGGVAVVRGQRGGFDFSLAEPEAAADLRRGGDRGGSWGY